MVVLYGIGTSWFWRADHPCPALLHHRPWARESDIDLCRWL